MTTEDDLNAAVGLGALFAEVAEVDPGWTAQIVSATGQPQDSVHCDRTLCGQPSDWYMSIAMMGADGGESGFEAAYSVIREWRPGSGAEFVVIVSDEDEHGAIAPSEFRAWADQRGIRMLAVVGDGDECGEEYPARYLQAAHVAGDLCGTWPSLAMVYP